MAFYRSSIIILSCSNKNLYKKSHIEVLFSNFGLSITSRFKKKVLSFLENKYIYIFIFDVKMARTDFVKFR